VDAGFVLEGSGPVPAAQRIGPVALKQAALE